ncbi:MAG: ATP-binding cassette domain-containing protein [Bdellovibrionales bacterium]|jgi:phospholipid/cholesterol/gamma-HCH transport system ATP-binding protein|nr:ATP-binding cassette domain-containing protein [Bdellovibrionales bacterium]MBL7671846.1 ATP-binding cassette domain-containing protein [Pseudobdellovibrionaceae bacterium]
MVKPLTSAVILKDVKKTFDGKDYVLKGIDLSIPKGSLTAIIGFSGTGKSVVLKHMLGLFKPTSGSIEVLGQDLNELNINQLTLFRQKFGVLFQSAALFDDMTVLENVCFPLTEHRRDLTKVRMAEIAEEKLLEVGLEKKHFGKLPSEISGGMQKRTGLARALALDPDILIYDEPTTGLDPILTEMVDDLIVKTHKHRQGITSIMVSHDLYAAFRIADYVAMLDAGRVLLYGTPDDFYNSNIELVKKFVAKGMKH